MAHSDSSCKYGDCLEEITEVQRRHNLTEQTVLDYAMEFLSVQNLSINFLEYLKGRVE